MHLEEASSFHTCTSLVTRLHALKLLCLHFYSYWHHIYQSYYSKRKKIETIIFKFIFYLRQGLKQIVEKIENRARNMSVNVEPSSQNRSLSKTSFSSITSYPRISSSRGAESSYSSTYSAQTKLPVRNRVFNNLGEASNRRPEPRVTLVGSEATSNRTLTQSGLPTENSDVESIRGKHSVGSQYFSLFSR